MDVYTRSYAKQFTHVIFFHLPTYPNLFYIYIYMWPQS